MEVFPPNIEVKKVLLSTYLQSGLNPLIAQNKQSVGVGIVNSPKSVPSSQNYSYSTQPATFASKGYVAPTATSTAQQTQAINSLNSFKFILPAPMVDVIYTDWSFCSGLVAPCCISIEEFYEPGLTLNNVSYWKYLNNPSVTNNTAVDYLPRTVFYPRTINTITVKLYDENGNFLPQDKDWVLELVIVRTIS